MPHLEYDLITLEFENGVIAHVTADWSRPEGGHFSTKMEIVGTKGIVEYNMDESVPLQVLTATAGEAKEGVAIPESPLEPRSNPYAIEIIKFLKSIEDNTKPPIPVREALESLNVVLCVLESVRTNKPVKVQGVF